MAELIAIGMTSMEISLIYRSSIALSVALVSLFLQHVMTEPATRR